MDTRLTRFLQIYTLSCGFVPTRFLTTTRWARLLYQRIADFLKHVPWLARLATLVYRQTRPHYTAGVAAVILNEQEQVLVVEHVFHPEHPWGLPGGWVDRREALETAIAREMQEELQLNIEILMTLSVQIVPNYPNHIDIAYLCVPLNPVGRLSTELLGHRWADLDDLPDVPRFHAFALDTLVRMKQKGQLDVYLKRPGNPA